MASIDPTSLVGNVIKLNPLNSTSNTTTSATDTNAFAQMLAQEILSGDLTGLSTSTNTNTNSSSALMSSLLGSSLLGSGGSTADPLSSLLSGSSVDSSLLGSSSLDSSLLGGTSSLFGSPSSSLLSLIMGSTGTTSASSMADLLSAELTGSLPYVSSMPLGSIGSVYAASATPTTTQSAEPAVTAPSTTSSSPSTTPTQSTIQNWIAALAPQYNLDPKLVDAVVNQESGYSSNATSSVGAMGLMQLMPATAAGLGVTNPYDPVQNLKGGMTYLRQLLTRYNNNVSLALAAYNAGPNAVDSYNGIPPYPQTQNYVTSIMRALSTSTS